MEWIFSPAELVWSGRIESWLFLVLNRFTGGCVYNERILAVYTVDIPEWNQEGETDTLHRSGARLHVSNDQHGCIRESIEDSVSIGVSPAPVVDLVQLAGHGQRPGELGQ